MRKLQVDNISFLLNDEDAVKLEEDGVIYQCSDPAHGHWDSYHLNPEDDSPYGIDELLAAVHRANYAADPTLDKLGVKTVVVKGHIGTVQIKATDPETLEKRKQFMKRNLALNAATAALSAGLFALDEREVDDGIHLQAALTIIPSGARAKFLTVAKLSLIERIQELAGVSDQRKEEAIALIRLV